VFVLTIAMAHGKVSRDAALFLFMGYATSIVSNADEEWAQ
jgi:hypothetical protein